MSDIDIFEVDDFLLQKGGRLPKARLAYTTFGTLGPKRDNVVLVPTWYAGTHNDVERLLIESGRTLASGDYFIIVPNMLGGGVSSSPSNTPAPFDRGRFPRITIYDNVALQHMLLREHLNIARIRLVASWSMGACQAFQWATQFPDMVQAIAPIAGSAKTGAFNKVFLLALRRALELDPAFADGFYDSPPVRGLRAFAAVYAGWGFSEPFFRTEGFRLFNAGNYEEFVEYFWEPLFLHLDANDLLAQLWTWMDADVSDNSTYNGDFARALGAIKARTIILPGQYDAYFPPVDSEREAALIPNAECRVIPSIWGHMVAQSSADAPLIDAALSELLRSGHL